MNLDHVWDTLDTVKDPEIPTVSVVELGLIRQVGYENETLFVTIAPTFIACPALDVIREAIRSSLAEAGAPTVEIKTTLSPPWTSDWITSEGRRKLTEIGLAPPPIHGGEIEAALAQATECPYCQSQNTSLKNNFGPTLCRSIYFCNSCNQPFEQFKPI